MKRFGSANPSPVGPTGHRVSTPQRRGNDLSAPSEVKTRVVGEGSQITDVRYDSSLRQLIVTKGGVYTAEVDGARIAKASHDIPAAPTLIEGPVSWYPENVADRLFLPDDFEHADGFPPADPPLSNLPSGMGYARLEAGSLAVGTSRWDADSATYGSEDAPAEDAFSSLIAVTISEYGDDNTPAELILWYDRKITLRNTSYSLARRRQYFSITSSAGTRSKVSRVAEGDTDNSAKITLDRNVTSEEILTVQVGPAFYSGDTRSPVPVSSPIPATGAADKDCYVLVVNSTGEAIPEGTRLLLTKPIKVFDDNAVFVYVWRCVPMASSGGAAAPRVFARFYGGNAPKYGNDGVDDLYPDYKPWLYQPEEQPDGSILPPIDDWENYRLPVSFDHGDNVPSNLPFGLGYARLLRDSSIGTYAWNADVDTYGDTADDPGSTPSVVKVIIRPGDLLRIIVFFSEAITSTVVAADLATYFALSTDSVNPVSLDTSTAVSVTANEFAFSISRAVEDGEALTLDILSAFAKDANDNWNVTYSDLAVTVIQVRNCYPPILNYYSGRELYDGEIVELIESTTLTDETPEEVSRTVYLAMPISAHGMHHSFGLVKGGNMPPVGTDPTIIKALAADSEIPEIVDWDTYLIPDTFDPNDGANDALPELPDGLGWVRVIRPDKRIDAYQDIRELYLIGVNRTAGVYLSADDAVILRGMTLHADTNGQLREVYEIWV